MDLKVFIFTWNTQTVRYNVDNGPKADFIDTLSKEIIDNSSDLVVIGLQEDSIRDSPLIDLLTDNISQEYELLKTTTLSGWGSTTVKALKEEWTYRPRGLRLAIYKRNILNVEIYNIYTQNMLCPSFYDWVTFGKGGVSITLDTDHGIISFLNTHLPFNSASILKDSGYDREYYMNWQATCLSNLCSRLVTLYNPHYYIVLGDLNFRVQLGEEKGALEIANKMFETGTVFICKMIKNNDELGKLINEPDPKSGYNRVPKLLEGINNNGPIFYPTCKLRRGRKNIHIDRAESFRVGKSNQRAPSWCDRILYTDHVDCINYKRWDYGNMNYSDHCAVVGIYTLRPFEEK